jgi:hypothetical protein
MTSRIEEDFELELRSLPGVISVGIGHDEDGGVEVVTLVVTGQDPVGTRGVAAQIASLYYPEAAVVVEDANSSLMAPHKGAPRVAIISAEYDPTGDVSEVHLSYNGRVGIGRSGSGPLNGGAEATLAALRDLGFDVPFALMTAIPVTNGRDWPVIVTLRSKSNDASRFGIARSDDQMDAAVKATLDSLNRFISTLESRS